MMRSTSVALIDPLLATGTAAGLWANALMAVRTTRAKTVTIGGILIRSFFILAQWAGCQAGSVTAVVVNLTVLRCRSERVLLPNRPSGQERAGSETTIFLLQSFLHLV